MILNAYAVLALAACTVRALLGLLVAGGAVATLRRVGPKAADRSWGGGPTEVEDRYYLLFLAALVLAVLSWVAWPLLYVVLGSYVPQWPGAMCIYGITQIGRGSEGLSRVLPGLISAVEALRPTVAWLGGLWLAVYLVNRGSRSAVLLRPMLGLLILVGLASAADAALEGAWLALPKRESFLGSSCCNAPPPSATDAARIAPAWQGRGGSAALVGLHAASVICLVAATSLGGRSPSATGVASATAGRSLRIAIGLTAAVALVSGVATLAQVAGPWLMGLPHHRCLYCLLATRPETIVSGAGLLAGCSLAAWGACLVAWEGRASEAGAPLALSTWRVAAWCLAGYGVMLLWQVVLARW